MARISFLNHPASFPGREVPPVCILRSIARAVLQAATAIKICNSSLFNITFDFTTDITPGISKIITS